MKVSVITVCYNSVDTIIDTIKSVTNQSYSDIEYIVVDGASNDGTVEILNNYSQSINRVISEHDSGIYDAMNKGIAVSTGDVISILNSDDVFTSPDEISLMVSHFRAHPRVDIIFGDVKFKDFQSDRIVRTYSGSKFKPYKLRFGWMPPHPATFVRRRIYENYGVYSTDFQIASDYERFVCWLLVHKCEFLYIPKTVAFMRTGGASTANLSSRITLNSEILKILRRNGIYSNWLFLLFKVPLKLLELTRRS